MNNTQIAAIEIAQLRAALAESQRRETAMAEELLRLREVERRWLAESASRKEPGHV